MNLFFNKYNHILKSKKKTEKLISVFFYSFANVTVSI
mgnify:FL=1